MLEYWTHLSNDMKGIDKTITNDNNLAMLWGSMNEECALVTYLQSSIIRKSHLTNPIVKETGVWFLKDKNNKDWLASSPDGLMVEDSKTHIVLEIKCPFMGGKHIQSYVNHIPQLLLEMLCTSTSYCHYIVWTPVGTKVFLVEKDDNYTFKLFV